MKKKRWIQKVLTFLLITTLVLQPVPLSLMQITSVISSAEETDSKEEEKKKEERKRKEEEERKKQEEEERKREEERKKQEEEERKRKEEEERKKQEEEERKREEEEERKKQEEEERKREEEEERKEQEEEERKREEEEERKKQEEEERKREEEEERKKQEEEEKKREEEEERKKQEEEMKKEEAKEEDSSGSDNHVENEDNGVGHEDSSEDKEEAKSDIGEKDENDAGQQASEDEEETKDTADNSDDQDSQSDTQPDTEDQEDSLDAEEQQGREDASEGGSGSSTKETEDGDETGIDGSGNADTRPDAGHDAGLDAGSEETDKSGTDSSNTDSADAEGNPAAAETGEGADTENPSAGTTENPAAGAVDNAASGATENPSAGTTENPAAGTTENPAAFTTEIPAEAATMGVTEEAVKMPEKTFHGSANGVSVTVKADEGTFPEGTEMKVRGLSSSSVKGAVENAIGEPVDKVKAVDISFWYQGKEIQPEKSVEVSLKASDMEGYPEYKAVHISGGSGDVVDDMSSPSAHFDFDHFSPFALAAPRAVSSYEVNFYYVNESGEETFVESRTIEEGQALGELPEGPARSDAEFNGWFYDGSEVTAETLVTGEMKIMASYTEFASVVFMVDGETYKTYQVEPGEALGSLPQAPFKEGSTFEKWVDASDETVEVTAATVVPEDGLTAVAVFNEINIYDVTVKYFYVIDGNRYDFSSEVYEIQEEDVPYTITVPSSTQVDPEHHPDEPTYYPSEPSIQVTTSDLEAAGEDKQIEKEVEYVEYTAEYDFVYYLKNLDGQGYTELEREHIRGVMGSTVTATVKEFPNADFERTESVTISQREGQEIPVYYTRARSLCPMRPAAEVTSLPSMPLTAAQLQLHPNGPPSQVILLTGGIWTRHIHSRQERASRWRAMWSSTQSGEVSRFLTPSCI